MVLIVLALLWVVTVAAGSMAHGGGRPLPARVFGGLLLGRWASPPGEEPGPGELVLVFAGRMGALLVLLSLVGMIAYGQVPSALVALFLLAAGPAVLTWLACDDGTVLAGLNGVRVFLRLPDGYLLLAGRVAGGGAFCGSSLAALDLRRRGLLVLAVGRSGRGGGFVHFPKGQEVLSDGDLLIIYGRPQGANGLEA